VMACVCAILCIRKCIQYTGDSKKVALLCSILCALYYRTLALSKAASAVCSLLPALCSLLSAVFLSALCCLLSAPCSLLSAVCCLPLCSLLSALSASISADFCCARQLWAKLSTPYCQYFTHLGAFSWQTEITLSDSRFWEI
jgi:hypothetical protein